MSVHLGMIWLAVRSTGTNRSVEHFDLVMLPDGAGGHTYGIFSQPEGEGVWKETFDATEALTRLQSWVHEEMTPTRRPRSQITTAGRQWLAQQT
jgi:hypothetical protein